MTGTVDRATVWLWGSGNWPVFSRKNVWGLVDLLTAMIERGEMALCSNGKVQDAALRYYNEYLENRRKALLAAEVERRSSVKPPGLKRKGSAGRSFR